MPRCERGYQVFIGTIVIVTVREAVIVPAAWAVFWVVSRHRAKRDSQRAKDRL